MHPLDATVDMWGRFPSFIMACQHHLGDSVSWKVTSSQTVLFVIDVCDVTRRSCDMFATGFLT